MNGLFGDAQNVITFTGGGYYKGIFGGGEVNYFDSSTLIANHIISEMRGQGWDIRTVDVSVGWIDRNWYNVTISINAIPNDNPARIQQALLTILSNYFDLPQLDSSAIQTFNYDPETGQTVIVDTYKDETSHTQDASLWEQIFGKKTSAVDAGGKILGLSAGTIALIAIGYIVIQSIKRK